MVIKISVRAFAKCCMHFLLVPCNLPSMVAQLLIFTVLMCSSDDTWMYIPSLNVLCHQEKCW